MPSKPKSVKETPASYHAKRKRPAKPATPRLALRWEEIETATQPIVLKKNGKPVAVVIRYKEYERLSETGSQQRALAWSNLETLLTQVQARTQHIPAAEVEADITDARQEVRDQHHARRRS